MFFELNEKEKDAANVFYKKHFKKCKSIHFSMDFFATGIGTSINVTCEVCGKDKDITDYDCW